MFNTKVSKTAAACAAALSGFISFGACSAYASPAPVSSLGIGASNGATARAIPSPRVAPVSPDASALEAAVKKSGAPKQSTATPPAPQKPGSSPAGRDAAAKDASGKGTSGKGASGKGASGKVASGKSGLRGLEKALTGNSNQLPLGVLFAAVPGSVLALGDTMLETAMNAPFDAATPEGRPVWGRMSASTGSATVQTGLRAPGFAAQHEERLLTDSGTAQFGTPLYRNASTRIDATFGLGMRAVEPSAGNRRPPQLRTYSGAVGAVLQHRAPAGIDLRIGTQVFGGWSALKGPGLKSRGRDLNERFRHTGVGVRAEISRDFALGGGLGLRPLIGVGASTAWVQQSRINTDNHSTASAWASARLNYAHMLHTGRQANFWIEPAYISQLKRQQTLTHKMGGTSVDITSRLGRDRAGLRLGMALPVGKQGTLQAEIGRFWGVGNARRQDSTLHLGYAHRF